MDQLTQLGGKVGEYMRNEIDKVLRLQIEQKELNIFDELSLYELVENDC